ncbi:MAG: AraC family transcriptional regulator [Lactobacillus sp.]|nr:AraC family transcriptional regulator [Lactobacillus sp.]
MIKAKVVRDTFIRTELNYIDHPQAQLNMHYHDECEFMLILDGQGDFIYDGKHYPAKAGSLFIIKPEVPHRLDMIKSNNHIRIVIEFDGQYMDKKTKAMTNYGTFDFFDKYHGVYQLPTSLYQKVQSVMTQIVNEQVNKQTGYLDMIACKLCELFLVIHRDLKLRKNDAASSPQRIVQGVINYIEDHPSENLSLADLSKQFFVSREYLSRIFKTYQQTTVQNYVNLSKSRTAKELLNATTDSIAHIAKQLGYQSTSYFSTVFKNQTGMSPSQYRTYVKMTDQLENDYNNRNLKSKRLLEKIRPKDY